MLGINWFKKKHPLIGKKVQATIRGVIVTVSDDAFTKTYPLSVVGYLVGVTPTHYQLGDNVNSVDTHIPISDVCVLETYVPQNSPKDALDNNQKGSFDLDDGPSDPTKYN